MRSPIASCALAALGFALVGHALARTAPSPGAAAPAAHNSAGVYSSSAVKLCDSKQNCIITFAAIPASKVLTVLDASCSVEVTGTGSLYLLLLTSNGNTDPIYLKPVLVTTIGNTKYYAANDSAYAPYPAPFTPQVYADTNVSETDINLECTIGGPLH